MNYCRYMLLPSCESIVTSDYIDIIQLQPTFKLVKLESGKLGDKVMQVYRKIQNYRSPTVTTLMFCCCCCLQLQAISLFSLHQYLVTSLKRKGISGQATSSPGWRKAAVQRSLGVAASHPMTQDLQNGPETRSGIMVQQTHF